LLSRSIAIHRCPEKNCIVKIVLYYILFFA
jgi:hypothetical protein